MMEFAFERNFDAESSQLWMRRYWTISVLASILYVLIIFVGRKVMHNRAAFDLKTPLICWNALLAIFSIVGTVKLLPEFLHTLKHQGLVDSYCRAGNFYKGANGFWMMLFTMSKLLELGDSMFIVLRKRPLIFLHWYHHAATVMYLWYQYQWQIGCARWGTMMNFFVHAIMYSYYALKAANFRIPTKISMCITGLQLAQMIMGSYICVKVFSFVVLKSDPSVSCPHPKAAVWAQLVMYISYLYLFARLFYYAYIVKRPRTKVAKE